MKPVDFFPLYNDLDKNHIKVDYHLHSTWTDGKNTVEEIVNKATENNLDSIAITDHIRKDSGYFDDSYNEIIELRKKSSINIYSGFEAKIEDFHGNVDVLDSVTEKADIAIASVHRFPIGQKLFAAKNFSKEISQEIELELSLAAIKKQQFNVLGHAGGMSIIAHQDFPVEFFEEIIIECKKNGIAFDFSGRYHRNHVEVIGALLKKHNPHVSIGTDSHSINKMFVWNERLKDIIECQ